MHRLWSWFLVVIAVAAVAWLAGCKTKTVPPPDNDEALAKPGATGPGPGAAVHVDEE